MPRKKREVVETTIRIPVEVHTALKELADQDYRLLSQEIVYALQQYVALRTAQQKVP